MSTNLATAGVERLEKRWRLEELVVVLSLSRRTIKRIFEKLPGVEFVGDRRGSSKKRCYAIMLVPDSVLRAELARWRQN